MWRVNDAEEFETINEVKNLNWLIELHRSFMNTMKIKGPRTEPCDTPDVT
jgi:hypothetical protein